MNEELSKTLFGADYRAAYENAEPKDFTPLDFVAALGTARQALLYSALYAPEFDDVEGLLLFKDVVATLGVERIATLRRQYEDDRRLEGELNEFDVGLHFPADARNLTDELAMLLAQELARVWAMVLRGLYPGRALEVRVLDNDDGPCVTVSRPA
jgi:hypothetical protein